MSTPSAKPMKGAPPSQAVKEVKRFHYWVLSGKGYHIGRFPIAAGVEPNEYVELHYDEKGTCVLIREIVEGYEMPVTRRPVFDTKKRMAYSDREGPDEHTKVRNEYEYGPDGLLCARQEKDRASGQVRFRVVCKYDGNGWPIEQRRFEGDGKESHRSVFEVDSEGFFTKETKYFGGELKGHYLYRRDDKHREIGREWYGVDGKLRSSCATRYGDHDLPVELRVVNPDRSVLVSKFTYDARGKTVAMQVLDGAGKVLEESRAMPGGARWKRSTRAQPTNLPEGTGTLGVPVHRFEQLSDEQASEIIKRGLAQFQKGDYIEALPMFQIASARYPNDPYFLYAMGLCSLKLRRYEAAIVYYRQALALDPSHAPSAEGLELATKALPYMQP